MILMRFRLLVSAILIALVHCISPVTVFAQSSEGWLSDDATANVPAIQVAGFSGSGQQMTVDGAPSFPPPSPAPGSFVVTGFAGSSSAPDEITPEIAALTQGVINGPGSASAYVKCFLFVTNQIEYEHYYGCKKGALLTYLERKGGDADLATLLVAMLRSAGYTARYGYGVVGLPTVSDPNGITAQNWLGTAAGSSTAASVNTMSGYFFQRGFPAFYRTTAYDGCFLHRVWVEVNVGGTTWVQLDPALKKRVRLSPAVDVTAASGYDRTVLKTAAGGTITSTSVDGMDYAALSAYLTERTSVMLGNLDSNYSGTDAVNLLGGWRQEPFLLGNGNQLFFPGSLQAALPGTWDAPQQFDALPASLLTNITLEVRSTASGTPVASYTMPMANLEGRRLSLIFTAADATGQAQLWLDDNLIAQEASAAIGTTVKLKITIDHPHNNSISPTLHDQFTAKDYFRGSRYALVYSFNPTSELLKARQQQLDLYRRSGLPDTTREVVTETLNVIGLTWLHQTELMKRVLGGKTNCDTTYHHRLGRGGQDDAYYIDMNLQFDGLFSLDGNSTLQTQVYNTVTYYLSAMEHGVLEQLQGAANPALSTVKLLRLSNQQAAGSRKTFYANSQASWNSIYPSLLQNYSQNDVNTLALAISQGGEVLVPQKGNITLNHWTGAGYVTRVTASGATTTVMGISGVLNGGFASIPGTVSIPAVTMFTNSNPIIINTAPIALPPTLTSEPIDLASGDYVFPTTDLTVGSGVPRGFSFARQYHGGRRLVNPAGLGYGWTHNWQVRATRRTAYEPALGIGGTALDVAAMLVAAQATLDLSSVATDAQHWTLANLVSHWLADQLQDNAVAISIGERSMQFTRRADGTWQSPGGITTTLAPNGSGWQVQERHGNSYNFDASGHLTSIADLWGKTLNVAYNGSDQVSTVTDAYARSLTFTYTGGKLASVADSTGRTVSFTYNGSGDLVVAGDPEGKADRFAYDGEHRITEIRNHDNQLVATNTYDSTGKLIE